MKKSIEVVRNKEPMSKAGCLQFLVYEYMPRTFNEKCYFFGKSISVQTNLHYV